MFCLLSHQYFFWGIMGTLPCTSILLALCCHCPNDARMYVRIDSLMSVLGVDDVHRLQDMIPGYIGDPFGTPVDILLRAKNGAKAVGPKFSLLKFPPLSFLSPWRRTLLLICKQLNLVLLCVCPRATIHHVHRSDLD